MSSGRGAPRAPNRGPDPPGLWRCVKCSNFVRRGTARCGCGHTPPERVPDDDEAGASDDPPSESVARLNAQIREIDRDLKFYERAAEDDAAPARARAWAKETAAELRDKRNKVLGERRAALPLPTRLASAQQYMARCQRQQIEASQRVEAAEAQIRDLQAALVKHRDTARDAATAAAKAAE